MSNLNRDYLVKINIKEGNIETPKMVFWNTDKKTSNMFIKLVINMSENELIKQYVTVQNATDYKVILNVIKPKSKNWKTLEADLLNESEALFSIDLPDEFKDQVGDYTFEFEVSSKVEGIDETITTASSTYTVNPSILTGLNKEIESDPDLPILKELINRVENLQGANLSDYQKITDSTLETTDKTVPGAINELKSDLVTIANEKVNKVDGKGLSTNDYTNEEKQKLEGLSNYVHPSTHDASIIEEDATHRFVTDEEKEKWNSATGVTDEQIDSAVTTYLNANPVTGGLTTTAKNLLITILRNTIYSNNQSANITALESALASSESGGGSGGDTPSVTTYNITNNLTNCVNSNVNTSVVENSSYIANITANDGYTLDSVIVTMGGEDITSSAYSNGQVNISSVTGDIVITASAIEKGVELNTNGLVALFDKDSEIVTNGAYPEYQYQILPKQGDYILGSWNKQINATDTHGVHGLIGSLSKDKQHSTTIASPTTWAVCTYISASGQNGYAPNNLTSNFGSNFYFISCNPKYVNTSGESVESGDISSSMGDRGVVGYHRLIMVIDGNILKIYKNAKLLKTLNGSDFTDFASWKTPTGIGAGFGDTMYTYFEAIYNRALSEVEVVELDAYIQTLEVTE